MAHLSLVDLDKHAWRVPRKIVAVKVAATVAFALGALLYHDDLTRLIALIVAAVAAAAYAVRDVLAPVRLTADADGLGVSQGFLGRRHISWGEVERIRVDSRRRFGGEAALLEIDIDTTLFLFSRHELGEDPHQAALTLNDMRQRARSR